MAAPLISDEELTELALAADPDAPIPDDAVPFGSDADTGALLPAWYMPVSGPIRRTRTRSVVVVGLIAAMLVIEGAGLCTTYGFPEIAW